MKLKFSALLVLGLIFLFKPCSAQTEKDYPPVDSLTHDYKYEEVIQVSNATKEELYRRANMALTALFSTEKDIIQNEDSSQGFIVANVFSSIPDKGGMGTPQDAKFLYNITLQVKNGKYRYVIDKIVYTYITVLPNPKGGGTTETKFEKPLVKLPSLAKSIKRQANAAIEEKITALKKTIEGGTSGNIKKDW